MCCVFLHQILAQIILIITFLVSYLRSTASRYCLYSIILIYFPSFSPDGGENEIEKLILAAEALALERAKLKLHGSLLHGLNMSRLPQELVRGDNGGEGRSFSAATTISAREAGNVHLRITKSTERSEKSVILGSGDTEGAMSVSSGMSEDVLHIVKYTSDHSVCVGNCDGLGQTSQGAEKCTDSQASSFCDSAMSRTCTSSISSSMEQKSQVSVREMSSSQGEAVTGVPKLSLELTDESGFSSNPPNERPAIDMMMTQGRQSDVLPDAVSSSYYDERFVMERLTNDVRQIDDRPLVSKNEKDECNSSIRGSATGGGHERSLEPRREGDERCHGQSTQPIK